MRWPSELQGLQLECPCSCFLNMLDRRKGSVAVSGASGGVGSLSLEILKKAGYKTAAVTGKTGQDAFFNSLGVDEVISRADMESGGDRPMLKTRFAGAVDTTGGRVLETLIKSVLPMGAVTCCGNAASGSLEMTVYPFILRGVSLIGIDSQNCPINLREKVLGTSC